MDITLKKKAEPEKKPIEKVVKTIKEQREKILTKKPTTKPLEKSKKKEQPLKTSEFDLSKEEGQYPRVVEKRFLRESKLSRAFKVLRGKDDEFKSDLKEPVLNLMRNDGFMYTIEGVQAGFFKIKQPDGKNKTIYLTADKLIGWKYGNNIYKTWIAYEDEAFPYPMDVVKDATQMLRILEKVTMNYRELETKYNKERTKFWIMVIGMTMMALYFANSTGLIDKFMGDTATTVATTVAENVTNTGTIPIPIP